MYLAEGDRGVNPEIIRVTETELANPSKVGLILKLSDTVHFSLKNFLGEISVESLDDSVDLLSLERAKLRDGNTFERNDSVVLSGTTEVSAKKKERTLERPSTNRGRSTYRSSKAAHLCSGIPWARSIPSQSCANFWFSSLRSLIKVRARTSSWLKSRRPA